MSEHGELETPVSPQWYPQFRFRSTPLQLDPKLSARFFRQYRSYEPENMESKLSKQNLVVSYN